MKSHSRWDHSGSSTRFVFARPRVPADPARAQPPSQRQAVRIEYLDYRGESDAREYRLAVHLPEGTAEVRVRIPIAAFAANRVLLQDGPDVCYQRLLRMLSAGEAPSRGVIIVDDAELAAYREAHTPSPRRSANPKAPPKRAPVTRSPVPEKRPKLPVATTPPPAEPEQTFDEGQRVSHALFGAGVTMGSSGGRTSIQFDDHGVRTFLTSMLELEVLSAPREWQAGPRGKNRRRDANAPDTASGKRRS
jgi:hypothetical protein